jgi:hypothetical protein
VVDKPLNEDQMIGEALAIVMGTTREVIITHLKGSILVNESTNTTT